MRILEWWRVCNAPVAGQTAAEEGDAHLRELESIERSCSRTDSGGKERGASEVGSMQRTYSKTVNGRMGRCVSMRDGQRVTHQYIAKTDIVEWGDACPGEVESVQRTFRRPDNGGKESRVTERDGESEPNS